MAATRRRRAKYPSVYGRKVFHARRQGPFYVTRSRTAANNAGSISDDAQHRARSRSLAHDDTHSEKPASLATLRRAFRGNSSQRCRKLQYRRRGHHPHFDRKWGDSGTVADIGASASGIDLRSDALDRPVRIEGPRRHARACCGRCDFRTTSIEEYFSSHRAICSLDLRLCRSRP